MSPRLHEFLVILQRKNEGTPWGIRLVGGSDLNAPLIITKVTPRSPAEVELLRGDVITKIEDYDARDLTHQDAQRLFRQAEGQIKLVIRRDDIVAVRQTISADSSRCNSTIPPETPDSQRGGGGGGAADYGYSKGHRSPIPHGPHNFALTLMSPVENLPHTVFPPVSPLMDENRNFTATAADLDSAATAGQPYRTTPLILPGAKVNKNNLPTESYLRYHPNPDVRNPPAHNFVDTLMKQKVADAIIQRVVGSDGKFEVSNKQFNSPIGLYSNDNIESTIKSTVPADNYNSGAQSQQQQRPAPREVQIPIHIQGPAHAPAPTHVHAPVPAHHQNHQNLPNKVQGYKKTVVFDPLTSPTLMALNEQEFDVKEVASAEPRVFRPNRLVPAKKPVSSHPAPEPEFYKKVNSMGEATDVIHQSNSFKRLMYHVLSETDY